jgi:hypothetical protein
MADEAAPLAENLMDDGPAASWPKSSSPTQKLAAHTPTAHHPPRVASCKFDMRLGDFIMSILFMDLPTIPWV